MEIFRVDWVGVFIVSAAYSFCNGYAIFSMFA
jgi:hypothetical protein